MKTLTKTLTTKTKFPKPMSAEPVATTTDPNSGLRAWVYRDDNPESPDFLDEDAVFVTYNKSSRYTLGNKPVTEEEQDELLAEAVAKVPVYAYIHGGVTISSSPFSCGWDSGQSGWAIMTANIAKAWYGSVLPSQEQMMEALESTIKDWDTYFQGDVFGVVLTEQGSDEILESTWGIYTEAAALEIASEMLMDELASIPQKDLFDTEVDPAKFVIEHE